jgi:hypothetical protein
MVGLAKELGAWAEHWAGRCDVVEWRLKLEKLWSFRASELQPCAKDSEIQFVALRDERIGVRAANPKRGVGETA